MPNIISPKDIPYGYFFESDKGIQYRVVKIDEVTFQPNNTFTLIGNDNTNGFFYFKLLD